MSDDRLRIGFFVPALFEGSGGQKTILRHAAHLAALGHETILFVDSDDLPASERAARAMVELGGVGFERGWPTAAQLDVAIATAWFTAQAVADCEGARRRVYFVQDYEPDFEEDPERRRAADATYDLGLEVVTIGRWLVRKLEGRAAAAPTPFGVDRSIYRPASAPAATTSHTVCAVYQPEKRRRCPELLVDALDELGRRRPDVDIYVVGSPAAPPLSVSHHHLGVLTDDELADLYRMCGAGISLSATNPSRIPFEMLACGLPVVERFGPSTLLDFPPDAVTLAHPGPRSLAGAVIDLLDRGPTHPAGPGGPGTPAWPVVSLRDEVEAFARRAAEAPDAPVSIGSELPATGLRVWVDPQESVTWDQVLAVATAFGGPDLDVRRLPDPGGAVVPAG